MALTSTAINRNMQMYGVADIDAFIAELTDSITYKLTGGYMIVAGLMSDAQELIAMGQSEAARQMLNRAKAVLFDIMDGEMSGSAEVK